MAHFLISVLAGFAVGALVGMVAFYIYSKKKLEDERFKANVRLYHEVLLKQKDKSFQYSDSIRRVINRVHVALLVEFHNGDNAPHS